MYPLIVTHFFDSSHTHTEMTQANPQAIDYPYPTTNTPPLTTHHTLIVCGVLRCVCPCDDDRDAKEDDCDSDVSTSDQFSWKHLRTATILVLIRQKPSTNVMLFHCRGVDVTDRKVAGGFPSPTMV